MHRISFQNKLLFPLLTVGTSLVIGNTCLVTYFNHTSSKTLIANSLLVGIIPLFLQSDSFKSKIGGIVGGAFLTTLAGSVFSERISVTWQGILKQSLAYCIFASLFHLPFSQKQTHDKSATENVSGLPKDKRQPIRPFKELRDENLQFMEVGGYKSSSGRVVELTKKEILRTNTDAQEPLHKLSTEIIVVEKDCLDAAHEETKKGYKTAVVAFVSTREPGGAFSEGKKGTQEEEICYRSTFGGFMMHQIDRFYEGSSIFFPLAEIKNEGNPAEDLPNKVLFTPGIQVFRDSSYCLTDDLFEIGVISCPAKPYPKLEDGKYCSKEDEVIMRSLIRTQLWMAYKNGYISVVCGAFGCGAFKNPPEEVSRFYKELLDTEFSGAFERVVFAILGDNVKPFQDVLQK